MFVLGYMERIAERTAWKAIHDWSNVSFVHNFYLIIITMTTVGYGDFVPVTALGKLIIVIAALWGGFIISLLIISVGEIFSLSVPQKIAYDRLIRVRSAVKCIIAAMRYMVLKKKYQKSINENTEEATSFKSFVGESMIKKVSVFSSTNSKKK